MQRRFPLYNTEKSLHAWDLWMFFLWSRATRSGIQRSYVWELGGIPGALCFDVAGFERNRKVEQKKRSRCCGEITKLEFVPSNYCLRLPLAYFIDSRASTQRGGFTVRMCFTLSSGTCNPCALTTDGGRLAWLQCIEPSEPSFMLKNWERLPVKSIYKLPAGSTVKAVEVTGQLTNGQRCQVPADSAVSLWREQLSVTPPPPPHPLSVRLFAVSTWELLIRDS